MTKVETALGSMSMNGLDHGVTRDTLTGSIDPRARLITTMVFIIVATSFGKYDILGLLPLVIYPMVLMALGTVPVRSIAKKLLYVSPLAIFIGIFNPLFDSRILVHLGPVGISGGWISFATIMLKFVLTVSAALILVASGGFDAVCQALARLKVPNVFVSQLMFMHRYIYVMTDQASRMVRAHSLRSFRRSGMSLRVFGSLIGQLLLRTLDRAQRIHTAMVSRGFTGEIPLMRELRLAGRDAAFVVSWSALFILVRLYNIPLWIGSTLMGVLS